MGTRLSAATNDFLGKPDGSIISRQRQAILAEIAIGKELQEKQPEIAELFRKGKTLDQIAKTLGVEERFGASVHIARMAIRTALVGNAGAEKGRDEEAYPGLIPPEDYRQIARAHQERGREVQREKGVGVPGQTPEEKRASGQKGAEALGFIPWSTAEEWYVLVAAADKSYLTKNGRVDLARIAREINEKYHGGEKMRVPAAVGQMIKRHKNFQARHPAQSEDVIQ